MHHAPLFENLRVRNRERLSLRGQRIVLVHCNKCTRAANEQSREFQTWYTLISVSRNSDKL